MSDSRNQKPERKNPTPVAAEPSKEENTPAGRVATPLRNWQVLDSARPTTTAQGDPENYLPDDFFARPAVEIEGEATPVDQSAQQPAEQPAAQPSQEQADSESNSTAIPDLLDPAIIVQLAEREQQIQPGEAAHYQISLLNNGSAAADFRVTVEGWLDERWLTTPIPQLALAPGEQREITLTLMPPRHPKTLAGEYNLAIVVREFSPRAERYGTHFSQRWATLTILPYTDLRLGRVQSTAQLSWWQQQATIEVPLANESNHPVTVALQLRRSSALCTYSVLVPPTVRASQQQHSGPTGPTILQLQAGQTLKPQLRLQLRQRPFFAPQPLTTTLHLTTRHIAQTAAEQKPWSRTAAVALTVKPLLGIWHLTSLLGLLIVTLFGMGTVALMALLFFGLSTQQSTATAPTQQAAAAPIIVAYIQAPVPNSEQASRRAITGSMLALTAPDGASHSSDGLPGATTNMGSATDTGSTTLAQSPILAPEQVSAPDAPASNVPVISAPIISEPIVSTPASAPESQQPGSQPALVATAPPPPATPAPMTFSTMFREIAHRYQLNWRVLAAQAYVESGFDTVALGADGDLGLMQILPATWHEWAPSVAATDPFDSYSNVLVAAAYLNYLEETLSQRGHPEPEWTLVAYNWGIDKVLQHLASGKGWSDLDSRRQQYAIEVLRLAETIPDGR